MTRTLKILPHVMIRTSGGSAQKLIELSCIESMNLIEDLVELNKKIAVQKEEVSEMFLKQLKSSSSSKSKKILINTRRSCYNQKVPSDHKLQLISEYLPKLELEMLEDYLSCLKQKDNLHAKIQSKYEDEAVAGFEKLKTLFSDQNLRKGLLLSAGPLGAKIDRIQDVDWLSIRKKDHQTILGLLKYLTRMYFKTSPFSTFTLLSSAKLSDDNTAFLQNKNSSLKEISNIRLNNYLFAYLKTLLTLNTKTNKLFRIRLNPTLKKEENNFLFLVNHQNQESFQRIPISPVLDRLVQLLSEKNQSFTIQSIVAHLMSNEEVEAGREDLEGYLYKLIEYGFVEYKIGISGVDTEWDLALVELLSKIQSEYTFFPPLIEVLKNLRALSQQYAVLNADKRAAILEDAYGQIREICLAIHEDAGFPADERKTDEELREEYLEKWRESKKKKMSGSADSKDSSVEIAEEVATKSPVNESKIEQEKFIRKSNTRFYFQSKQIYYEDVNLFGDFSIANKYLEPIIDKINHALNSLTLFESYFVEQSRMNSFFDSFYEKGTSVDLLDFYEDYFRHMRKPIDEFKADKNKQIKSAQEKLIELKREGSEPEIAQMKETIEQLKEMKLPEKLRNTESQKRVKVQAEWREKMKDCFRTETLPETIQVDSDIVKQVSEEIAGEYNLSKPHHSQGAFMQFYFEEKEGTKKLMTVLNANFSGYGKLTSRFLHILDKDFLEQVRKCNVDHQPEGSIYIEDMDASVFNANLHPPLLSKELCMPNGNNSLAEEDQIPVNRMEVKKMGKELCLIDKLTGDRLFVFDLGFQGHAGRSQLFQLAEKFTGVKLLFMAPILDSVGFPLVKDNNGKNGTLAREDDEQLEKNEKPKLKISRLPRVILDGNIVLRRATWIVPRTRLPFKKPEESNSDYFISLNVWRKKLKVPDEVFINVYAVYEKLDAASVKNVKYTKDDYKPQYINFTIPFTVILFEKILKKVPIALRVVEMLPNSNQLLRFGSEQKVSEFLVQWYNYGKGKE